MARWDAADAAAGTVKVEGLRELRRTLRQAGDDMADLKEANRAAAEIVATAAGGRVPHLTGALAASVRPAGTKTAAVVRAGKKAVPYANAIHWGRIFWPCKEADPHFRSEIAPRPFLSEAATSTESTWVPLYEDRIQSILDQVQGD